MLFFWTRKIVDWAIRSVSWLIASLDEEQIFLQSSFLRLDNMQIQFRMVANYSIKRSGIVLVFFMLRLAVIVSRHLGSALPITFRKA